MKRNRAAIKTPIHWTKIEAKYRCSSCKNEFKRTLKSSWSEIPSLNWEGRENELDQKEHEECMKRANCMECPKCDTVNRAKSCVPNIYVQR